MRTKENLELDQFVNAVNRSLATQNWTAALFITLTLPDICSRLESDNDRTNGEKYAQWFDKYLGSVYTKQMIDAPFTFMSGDDCYVLRCSMLHQGFGDVSHQKKKGVLDRFYFTALPQHRIRNGPVIHLNTEIFCREMLAGVAAWLEDFGKDHPDKLYKLTDLLKVHDDAYRTGGVLFTR